MKDLLQYINESVINESWIYHSMNGDINIDEVVDGGWIKKNSLSGKQARWIVGHYSSANIFDASGELFPTQIYMFNDEHMSWNRKTDLLFEFIEQLDKKFGDGFKGFFIAKASSDGQAIQGNWGTDINIFTWFDKDLMKQFASTGHQRRMERARINALKAEKVEREFINDHYGWISFVKEFGVLKPNQVTADVVKRLIVKYNISKYEMSGICSSYGKHPKRIGTIERDSYNNKFELVNITLDNIDEVADYIVAWSEFYKKEYGKYYKGMVFGRKRMEEVGINTIIPDCDDPDRYERGYWDRKYPISHNDQIMYGGRRPSGIVWTGD